MARRKKPKITKKARVNAIHRQKFLDSLPGNEKEHLELQLKFTIRAMDKQDDGTMARQAERIREKIKNLQ